MDGTCKTWRAKDDACRVLTGGRDHFEELGVYGRIML
jgi:hypothetical protein